MPHPKGGASGRHETNRHRRKKPSSEDRSIAARRWTHEGSRCTDSRLLHHQLATNSPPTLTTNSRPRTPHEPRTAISSSNQQSPSLRRLEFINRATVDSIASRTQTEGRAMASNLLGWTAVGRPSRERSTRTRQEPEIRCSRIQIGLQGKLSVESRGNGIAALEMGTLVARLAHAGSRTRHGLHYRA